MLQWKFLRLFLLSASVITIILFTLKNSKKEGSFRYKLLFNFIISVIGIFVLCFMFIFYSILWTIIDYGFANAYVYFNNNLMKITIIFAVNFVILASFYGTFIALYTFNGDTIIKKIIRGTMTSVVGLLLIDLSGKIIDMNNNNNFSILFMNDLVAGILAGTIIAFLVDMLEEKNISFP